MRGGRPKAPPCPSCGKALYKHPDKGTPVKKHWPYAWCRNEACELHNKDQSAAKKAPKRKKQKAPPREAPKPLPVEPEAVKAAREKIKAVVGDGAPNLIGLALAVLAQEIGSFKAANQLIDDFKLTESFGVQKLDVD